MCHTLPQRVSLQGGQACHIRPGPTKLGRERGSTKGRLGVYLQNNCSRCLLSWFASMVVLMIDPKTGFPRYIFSNERAQSRKLLLNTFNSTDPAALPFASTFRSLRIQYLEFGVMQQTFFQSSSSAWTVHSHSVEPFLYSRELSQLKTNCQKCNPWSHRDSRECLLLLLSCLQPGPTDLPLSLWPMKTGGGRSVNVPAAALDGKPLQGAVAGHCSDSAWASAQLGCHLECITDSPWALACTGCPSLSFLLSSSFLSLLLFWSR